MMACERTLSARRAKRLLRLRHPARSVDARGAAEQRRSMQAANNFWSDLMQHCRLMKRWAGVASRTIVACAAMAVGAPTLMHAQSSPPTERPAPAVKVVEPSASASRETRLQHDSLTVHFLRHPKGKPSVTTLGGEKGVSIRKFDGREIPPASATVLQTPVPTRVRARKP
jgi:hypothetical protein